MTAFSENKGKRGLDGAAACVQHIMDNKLHPNERPKSSPLPPKTNSPAFLARNAVAESLSTAETGV